MRLISRTALLALVFAFILGCGTKTGIHLPPPAEADQRVTGGLLHWRGPLQSGNSNQTGLPDKLAIEGSDANLRWTLATPGRGTATIAEYPDGPRLYAIGYPGSGAELLETLYCLNPETGEIHWQRGYADFISDIVYNRYSISSPTVDPQTGHVYYQTSPGLVIALDREGNELWQVSLMETYGKLTFPNGRTGVITIDGDLAIVNCISTNWGREGPARNRFYAFDKLTGELVWSSTPGVGPPFLKDSSFSTPHIENRRGYRVFYAGTGCGNLVCVNIRTGQPIWRYQMSFGGVNASPLIYDNGTPDEPADDLIIQVHGKENVGDTGRGYMIAIRADQAFTTGFASNDKPIQIGKEAVAWRNDEVSMFTSSPTIVDGVVYQCTIDGRLVAIDAKTGQTLWAQKFGTDQLHASPVYADGKMYLAMWHDGVYVFTPTRQGPKNIEQLKLSESDLCIGTPSVWNGKVYVHTTQKLYCFGNESGGMMDAGVVPSENVCEKVGQASCLSSQGAERGRNSRLRVDDRRQAYPTQTTSHTRSEIQPIGPTNALALQPAEFKLRPDQLLSPSFFELDAYGNRIPLQTPEDLDLEKFIPPNAKVKVEMDAKIDLVSLKKTLDPHGPKVSIIASNNNAPSAGAFKATSRNLTGTTRGRILPTPPYTFAFETFELKSTDKTDNVPYAHPPLPWIGARMKWQVREDPTDADNKVLAKTLDRVLFQRSTIFMGHADDTGYTVQADVMSDGNRRGGSVVGVVCQRYLIVLDANKKAIEVSSNPNRLQVNQPFKFKTKTWYTIKAKVVAHNDGSGKGTVYGKAWPRGEAEPKAWTIEVEVPNVHTQGSPGVYGFSPQSRHRVYIDNVKVDPNE